MTKSYKVLNEISDGEAASILRKLIEEDTNIAKRANEIAQEMLNDIDVDEIAERVFDELGSICVEDVWDNSGSTRDGYVDPTEYAWQLFEETLGSFLDEMLRYTKLAKKNNAKLCCMGILKGIYLFAEGALTEYKDWAPDAPAESFSST